MVLSRVLQALRARLSGRKSNAFGVPIHRDEAVSPFFIVGSGRCGSTLLRRILLHCSNVHIPTESQGIPSFVSAYLANPNLRWEDIVYLGVGNFEFRVDFTSAGVSVAGVVAPLIKLAEEQRSVARVIASIFEYHAQQSGRAGGRRIARNITASVTIAFDRIWEDPLRLNCKNLADLERDIRSNLHQLPSNVDLVVGVPRSGMLPATLFSQLLNVRLATLDEYLAGSVCSTGFRPVKRAHGGVTLVVDDSVFTGQEMSRVRKRIEAVQRENVQYLCVYGTKGTEAVTDIQLLNVPHPRIFSWNIMNSWMLNRACCDIDGVLCIDPDETENDDGNCYRRFLANAPVINAPRRRIRKLVTCRLEKYRKETERWLRSHGIEFDELVMVDGLTAKERRDPQKFNHGRFKAGIYKKDSRSIIFIESCPRQAKLISRVTGKWVFCYTTGEFVPPPVSRQQRRMMFHLAKRLFRKAFSPRNTLRQLLEHVH